MVTTILYWSGINDQLMFGSLGNGKMQVKKKP